MRRILFAGLIVGTLLTVPGRAAAQDTTVTQTAPATSPPAEPEYKQALYIEFGGNAVIYSVNYDRMVTRKISVRIGAGAVGVDNEWIIAVPLTLNWILGQGNNRFEIGAGVTFIGGQYDFDEDLEDVIGTLTFAYRYQKPNSVFFKAGVTPLLFPKSGYLPWFGVAIGTSF